MDEFLQLTINGLLVGGIYSLVAVGFVLIYKASGVFNLAQGNLLALGALICWTFIGDMSLPLWVGFPATLVCAILMGAVIERIAIRPLMGQSVFIMVMATLALSLLLSGIGLFKWGGIGLVRYPDFIPGGVIHAGDIFLRQELIWAFGIAVIAVIGLSYYFARTKGGLGMRAVAEDSQTALSTGVSVKRVVMLTWILAAILSATGGILIGTLTGVSLHLEYLGLVILPVVLLGGLDSIPGAIVAGLLVGVVENWSAGYIEPHIGLGFKAISPYCLALIVLIVRPHGLFGTKEIERI